MIVTSYLLRVIPQTEVAARVLHLDMLDRTALETNILYLREKGCTVTLVQAVEVVDTLQ